MSGKECPNCGRTLTPPVLSRLNNIFRLRQSAPCSNCGIQIRRTSMIYVAFTSGLASIACGILHVAYPQWPTVLGILLSVSALFLSSRLKIEIAPREAAPIPMT
jgi:hypothetical protein